MESLVHAMLSNAMAATILAVVVAGLGRTCRRPALIHSLWLVVMLKLVTPPVVSLSVPIPIAMKGVTASEIPRSAEPTDDQDHLGGFSFTEPINDVGLAEPAETSLDIATGTGETRFVYSPHQDRSLAVVTKLAWKWEHLVLALVLTGAIAWWALATVRIVGFQRVLRDVRLISCEWQARTDELAERLGLGRCPTVCLVPGRVPPMLWAIGGRPRLLLPTELWAAMSPDERTTLLLHELAHLKRRDHWVRWLELIVAGLYWWHPAAWWIRQGLREAEEQCCDAWVVWAMPRGAKTYATALLAALEFVSGARTAPAAASATSSNGHVSCLKRRLRMIVLAKTPKGLSWAGRLAVLGLAALLLPLAPSWAQNNDQKTTSADQVQAQARLQKAIQAKLAKVRTNPGDQKSLDALAKQTELLARLTPDDDKDDKPKTEQDRDVAEGLESQLKELLAKLSKELGPATEEVRKSLERALGEIHKSLEKEGLSGEDLAKALDRSQQELRKAFESGGPVEKEVREAIERARKDAREAMERAREQIRETARDRAQALRDQALERAEQDRSKRDEQKPEADKGKKGDAEEGEGQPNRQELESTRREIRELEQQLRRATNRLEALQRRESRRNPAARRPAAPPRAPVSPRAEPAPGAEPVAPKRPVPPAAPRTPSRGPAGGRRGPQSDNDRRLQNLEEKMNQLLKELQDLKSEPKPKESKESSSRNTRPSRPNRLGLPTA